MTKAAVVGLGTMGPGIAATLARGGMTVTAFDSMAEQRQRAAEGIRTAAGVLASLGVPDRGGGAEVRSHDDLAQALAGADLVVDCVPEKADIKAQVFQQIDSLVGKQCVIASNTARIPITKLQSGNSAPGRVVGMHWS